MRRDKPYHEGSELAAIAKLGFAQRSQNAPFGD
jgi:hypothetical protein